LQTDKPDVAAPNQSAVLNLQSAIPKIADFGLAKCAAMAGGPIQDGQVVGTPGYMSPEQIERPESVDGRSDVYSLGVILYELLTGVLPFDGSTPELLQQVVEAEPVPPHRRNPRVPRDLEAITLTCLAKAPGRRYATAGELAADLRHWLAGEPITARPAGRAERLVLWCRRNPMRAGLSAALALAVLALTLVGGGSWWWRVRTIEAALQQAVRLREAKKEDEALAVLRQAQTLLTAGVPQRLRKDVDELVNDLEMAMRLDEVRLQLAEAVLQLAPQAVGERFLFDPRQGDQIYRDTFERYGAPVESMAAEEAALQLRRRSITVRLALALDEWAMARRSRPEGERQGWQHLLEVARRADADEWRNRLRRSILEEDEPALRALAAEAQTKDLPGPTWVLLARLLRERGLDQESRSVFRLGHKQHPDDFWICFELGSLRPRVLKGPELDEALGYARTARALRPRNAAVCNNLGAVLVASSRANEAVEVLNTALELHPEYALALNNLGVALVRAQALNEGIVRFEAVKSLQPDWPDSYNNLGMAYLLLGSADKALPPLREALRLKPDLAKAHYNLGYGYARKKSWDKAIACYEQAIHFEPDNASAHYNLGNALHESGRFDAAVSAYRRALNCQPGHVRARENLGLLLRILGRQAEAFVALHEGIDLSPRSAKLCYLLGLVLWDKGAEDEAIAAFQEAIRLDPKYPYPYLDLGEACLRRQRFGRAADYYAQAFAAGPAWAADPKLGHRYNAARAAALAGCGRGRDAPPLDEKARAQWRRQALAWLASDLKLWTKDLDSSRSQDRDAARKALRHWQEDPDLAGLREAAALNCLLRAEQEAWRQFWAKVKALEDRPRAK
jgi:tetratricopeptide (TPR) repeat protein